LEYFGFLNNLTLFQIEVIFVGGFLLLAYFGSPLIGWNVFFAILLAGLNAPILYWKVLFGFVVLFNIKLIRRGWLSWPLLKFINFLKLLPTISKTEKTAIEAGSVWVDGEVFSGKPNYYRILKQPYPSLKPQERAFIDGPVEQLCKLVDDYETFQNKDFSAKAWQFIKDKKFFGMIIPKKYGGLEFSARGHSAVISKLASHSSPLAITIMVPNSLGPAELLVHYGTTEQKDYYLPRLANGKEIPCFALTEPDAGSDAGAMTSSGEVFKDKSGNLKIRLNFEKRYITLASISTIIGLAFKCKDPQNYLGKGGNPGITCAIIPTKTKGVDVSKKHNPLGIPFVNSFVTGKNVEIPVDSIIGGKAQVGNGWRMLMESLAAGRGISLPATSIGGMKKTLRYVSAYAKIRYQFGISIGKFEGVEFLLGKMAGLTYLMEAARIYTCGGIDLGQKPAVVTAIMKYHSTELLREVVMDGMDILGGKGISKGPRNFLANIYCGLPIGITVEGANILTRSLIIFRRNFNKWANLAGSDFRL